MGLYKVSFKVNAASQVEEEETRDANVGDEDPPLPFCDPI